VLKFLIIAQDLRVSGTSEGVVSRSFIAKLKKVYPDSSIDVFYLKQQPSDDQLDLLPVDKIETHLVDIRVPLLTRWFNKIYWRLFHLSLNERHVQKQYGSYMAKINYQKYDHIFIRSCGVEYETILGAIDLPILKKAIINFHDPYPLFWCSGNDKKLTPLELFRLKTMSKVVHQAKACMTPAMTLTNDMGYLYGSRFKFFTLPHQYDETVFNLSERRETLVENKKLTICYQGAIQFERDIIPLLEAYQHLVDTNEIYRESTKFIIRVKKRGDINALTAKYGTNNNIIVQGPTDFQKSSNEQKFEADINIIIENGVDYCNILVGKAPFLASLNKPILSISPDKSDLRMIINDQKYITTNKNQEELMSKLECLIKERLSSHEPVFPFGDYFSDENFKIKLDDVLFNKESSPSAIAQDRS
jgi:hypothetical protein